ncbi:MAG: tryptophan-rich sensory protein, partial [Roseibacillus sp.]|nr:tryptophan-rich sensory protein [Roseibacillus sp.]
NLAWTPAFFGWHRMDVALGSIGLLSVAVTLTVRRFRKIHRLAGWLLVPYLLWLGYASYLNAGFLILND